MTRAVATNVTSVAFMLTASHWLLREYVGVSRAGVIHRVALTVIILRHFIAIS